MYTSKKVRVRLTSAQIKAANDQLYALGLIRRSCYESIVASYLAKKVWLSFYDYDKGYRDGVRTPSKHLPKEQRIFKWGGAQSIQPYSFGMQRMAESCFDRFNSLVAKYGLDAAVSKINELNRGHVKAMARSMALDYRCIHLIDDSHMKIPVLKTVTLCEPGYITEEDMAYIKRAFLVHDDRDDTWYLSISSMPWSDDAEHDLEMMSYNMDLPAAYVLLHDDGSVSWLIEDSYYKKDSPYFTSTYRQLLGDIRYTSEQIEKKIRINLEKMGYDPEDPGKIDADHIPLIYHSKRIEGMRTQLLSLNKRKDSIQMDYYKKVSAEITNAGIGVVVVPQADHYALMRHRGRRDDTPPRSIRMSQYRRFIYTLQHSCDKRDVALLFADTDFDNVSKCPRCGGPIEFLSKIKLTIGVYHCPHCMKAMTYSEIITRKMAQNCPPIASLSTMDLLSIKINKRQYKKIPKPPPKRKEAR